MSADFLREIIIDLVNQTPGIRAVQLVTDAIEVYRQTKPDDTPEVIRISTLLPNMLTMMVSEGKLMEVEYVLSDMDYRIKSVYFPAFTSLKIVRQ